MGKPKKPKILLAFHICFFIDSEFAYRVHPSTKMISAIQINRHALQHIYFIWLLAVQNLEKVAVCSTNSIMGLYYFIINYSY